MALKRGRSSLSLTHGGEIMAGEAQTALRTTVSCRREMAWRIAALVSVLLIASIGCDPVATLGFLAYPFSPNIDDPVFSLKIPGKESKVVLLFAHEDNSASSDAFRDADLMLARQLASMLTQQYKENKEKIKIVNVSQSYQYMREHKDWATEPKQDIAKNFDADFLVYFELGPMTMYVQGSGKTLYQGTAEIHISVYDAHEADGECLKGDKFFSCVYPTTHYEDSSSMTPGAFRARFLDRIAKDLVPYFAGMPADDKLNKMEVD
jgi:hypothetical protein